MVIFLYNKKQFNKKFDVAKLMSEVLKHNGDVNSAINDTKKGTLSFDISKLKQIAANANTPGIIQQNISIK